MLRKMLRSLLLLMVVASLVTPAIAQATMVRMKTSLGVVDVMLFDNGAPITVANFLNYVNRNDYDGSFIHRNASYSDGTPFVLQGGGFGMDAVGYYAIPTDPAIFNEYSPDRSNERGTIAMAKVGYDPNSATSQWFFNLGDNSVNLNHQNGGFTVFGQVAGDGMTVVDAIAALDVVNANGAFTHLPLRSTPESGASIKAENLVMIDAAYVLPTDGTISDADRLFNFFEGSFQTFISPVGFPSQTIAGYYYRYYADTESYVGIKGGRVYYLGPFGNYETIDLGSYDDWLQSAFASGY